jgi:hypothetical protein
MEKITYFIGTKDEVFMNVKKIRVTGRYSKFVIGKHGSNLLDSLSNQN